MRGTIHREKTSVLASSRERLRDAAKSLFAERGYEATSTAAICRVAGTSQSQLIKHFTSKQGLLEAIFAHAWAQVNPAIQLAIENIPSPKDRLRTLVDMTLSFLTKDRELHTLFLLEGRRLRGDGHMVVLVPEYLDFVRMLDGILKEMAAKGELSADIHPQAFRSALMGAVEGMLRDRLLSRPSHMPASYLEADVRAVFSRILSSCMNS